MSRVVVDPLEDEYYKMDNKRRGIALIFNHYHFSNGPSRDGTNEDCRRIDETFTRIGFETWVCKDFKKKEIKEMLQSVAKLDHSKRNCLAVIVMSHGGVNVIHAYDEEYAEDTLWEPFTGDNCPTLAGKPKLFFIQACRGSDTDNAVDIQIDSNSAPCNTVSEISAMADILRMYSTPSGKSSYRSPQNGSWFIQTLCNELERKFETHDLHRILISVNRVMSLQYCYRDLDTHTRKKQVGQIVSTLTRLVKF